MHAAPLPADPIHLRRRDNNERFVAFAFAGAELMVEVETDGAITYATGAFRTRFGQPPEAFVGTPVRRLVTASDHEALESALGLLLGRGRLHPMLVRMADQARTRLALSGIVLPVPDRTPRLCLAFARPPLPMASVLRDGTAHDFARTTEARLRAGTADAMGLLEIAGPGSAEFFASDAIGLALEAVAPDATAGEIAPGRYGLLDAASGPMDMTALSVALQALLRGRGLDVAVTSRQVRLADEGLTAQQAARALRHALNVFARGGVDAVDEAGLGRSLSSYLAQAGRKTDALRRAIRDRHFNMLFQPIVSLRGRTLHHYEALIRPRPIRDLPLPGPQDFVMLVEALGLADELDICVAAMVCDAARDASLPAAFNLSGQSVQDPRFRDRLLALLSDHAARKAGLVTVEVTETAEIDSLDEAAATAQALRALGVPFCLDDFGTGTADMRTLRALKADTVKLDGSYVPGVARSGGERAFVAGMVEIARAVGADIVAERVETEEEAAALAELGVQYGQGWLFGRPGPLPETRRAGARSGEVESWG